jgi:hypothetical protein
MVDAKELNRLSDKCIKADLDAIHFFEFLEGELLETAARGRKKLQMTKGELELQLKRFCRSRNYTETAIKDICYNPFYRNYYINELRKRGYMIDFDIWDAELRIDWSATI